MRVLRSGAKAQLIFGLAALVLVGAIWLSFFREPPESWQLLAAGKLVKIEAEKAIYEKPDSPDYYLRVKVTNLSPRFVGIERYENARVSQFGLRQPLTFSCELAEGDHPAPINGMHPIFLSSDIKMMERSTLAKYRAGSLLRVAPGASQKFFLVSPNAKTQIARSWKNMPLWWKSKTFLPNDNLRSPYFIALINGQLTATDGQSAQWFTFRKDYLALKFPIKTKKLP